MNEVGIVTKDIADRGAELHKRLLLLSVNTTRNFFEFGEILKEIRDKQLWNALGCGSFAAYFSDPELSLSKSTVYHAIALVEHFPEWRSMMPVPISKLIAIVPHLTDENKPKLLEYAAGLSRSDLAQELSKYQIVNGIEKYKELPKIYWCNECKKIKGIFYNELCTCGWTEEQKSRLDELLKDIYVR